jgi:acyl-CoA thioesterase-1
VWLIPTCLPISRVDQCVTASGSPVCPSFKTRLIRSWLTGAFPGDSITGCGRQKEGRGPPGAGFVKRFSELIVALYTERSIGIVNRGVGGSRINDLRLKWRDDVLCMKPNWLSISIGINDVHSHLFGPEPRTNPEEFRRIYSNLLETLEGGLRRRTVLLDPFYIHRKSLEGSRETW